MTQFRPAAGIDLEQCANEPIHVPGAIQPHGCLVAFEPTTLVVQQVSANVAAFLGVEPQTVLGQGLEAALPPSTLEAVREILAGGVEAGPVSLRRSANPMPAALHVHQGRAILEFEAVGTDADAGMTFDIDAGLRRISMQADLDGLVGATAEVVRDLTGFDRVLVYRFDEDDHGEVVAEAREHDLAPYLGLHFPESDIPRQARELYRRNWIRTIPDARYTQVPLLSPLRPDQEQPLDLTHAMLRSVSAVHLEYLANMGLQASMSVSLLVEGRLWGLISCGHRLPRAMPHRLRMACETIGRIVSLQIGALEAMDLQRRKAARAGMMGDLVDALRHPDGHGLVGLPGQAQALLAITDAAGAAVISGETVIAVGACPDEAVLLALSKWIGERADAKGVFATRQLPLDEPRWKAHAELASGVLAMLLPTPLLSCVVWFRPELVHTVSWGGDPNKPLDKVAGGGQVPVVPPALSHAAPQAQPTREVRLHPRRSFDAWKQEVRGRSLPWGAADLEAVAELRRSAIEIDLYRQVQREQAAVKARDDLVAVVAHDLRTPMSVVVMQAAVIERLLVGVTSEERRHRLRASAQVVHRAGQRMATLLNDLLDLARIEAGRLEITASRESASQIIEDAYELLNPICDSRQQRLVVDQASELHVHADPERLFQVLSNLISNASKFSPEGSEIHVKVNAVGGGMCEFSVIDQGSGIAPEQVPRMFERYWQERPGGGGSSGLGLGLYISRGIVEAHGGSMRAESRLGEGTTVSFTVPLDPGTGTR